MRVCAIIVSTAFLSTAVFGQPAESERKFEAADIHTSPRATGGIPAIVRGPFYTTGRYEIRFATMADLISNAYGVDTEKVFGGPNWLEMDRYDIIAKTAGNTSAESRKLMLQALLQERFNLVVKPDTKPMPAYALSAGKKPSLKEAAESAGPGGCDFNFQNNQQGKPAPPPPGGGGSQPQAINLPTFTYTCHNTSMATLAASMLSMPGAAQYFDNKPVIDQTELKGNYDFTIKYTPKVPPGFNVTGENLPIFEAVDKQLGLKLEQATVPIPVISVETVEEKPTPNSPDLDKIFPPQPTEFEVAEIKPAPPQTPGQNNRPEIKNGRLYLPGISLQNLIQVAWDLPPDDDHLIGGPKWMNNDRFDIIAKAPTGVAIGSLTEISRTIPINIDALRPMLQAMIVEKFKLKVHTEERPLPAYTLTAKNPKLRAADPNERTKWHEGADPGNPKDKNVNSSLGRLVTCQNVNMAQFADMLRTIAPGYIHNDVIDATGMKGGYDFTFSFSPIGALQQAGVRPAEGGGTTTSGVGEAATPNGGISLFDAISKQLGLKLEEQKRPSTVLVIDHVEQKPSDN